MQGGLYRVEESTWTSRKLRLEEQLLPKGMADIPYRLALTHRR
jgi:hypothetical protein